MLASPQPLRILHVTDSAGLYGAESVILDLCAQLHSMGHRPIIASIGNTGDGDKPVELAARKRGLDVRALRMMRGPSLRGAFQILDLAQAEDVDVVHTHGYKGDILLGFLPKRWRPIPLVATVHGYTNVGLLDRIALYRWLDGIALRRVDRVVLVHRGMVEARGLNRLDDPRWRVIENGIRVDGSESSVDLDAAIVQACEARTLVIGAVGRLSKEKGFHILLRALAEILPSQPNALALILGEGPERATLEGLAARLGIGDRVLMPGYVSQARAFLRLCHLFVLPSLTEGLPITLLEAIEAGVPVVATRVGGAPAVLDAGRGGALVEPGNPSALAAAIQRLIDDRTLARQMADHSKARVRRCFGVEAMAARYLDLYREVALTRH